MDAVLRAASIYFALLILVRLSGKRTLVEVTTFDFVLLLVIGEATQQALLGDDFSVTNGLLVITTLLGIDIGISLLQGRFAPLKKAIEGMPLILVENGEPMMERMKKSRVGAEDVMEEARGSQGLERMEQIKYAVLERGGSISIIPKQG